MLPNQGSYRAQQNGTVIIRQEESGSLMAYIPYILLNCADPVNYSSNHSLTIGAKDGTPQTKNIATLQAIFQGWDKDNLADIEMPAEGEIPQFDLADCYHDDSYTPEGADTPLIQFRAKWLNVIGGGRKVPMTLDERKAAIAKWKTKLKALSGAKPAAATKPAEVANPAKPAVKAAVAGPPSRKTAGGQVRTSTQEEVWNGIVAWNDAQDNEKLSEEALAEKYFGACDNIAKGSSENPALLDTPAKWGEVANELGI